MKEVFSSVEIEFIEFSLVDILVSSPQNVPPEGED